jgi:hypothetical protein
MQDKKLMDLYNIMYYNVLMINELLCGHKQWLKKWNIQAIIIKL